MAFDITVAILNWNGLTHLQEFLPSVVLYSEKAHILLIDNASTDESVSWIQQKYPQIQIVIHSENLGFTEGYNLGLEHVTTPFAILLNSDVEVTSGWLDPLLARIQSDQKIVAVQPKILSYSRRDTFEYAGASGGLLDAFGYPFCRGRIFNSCEIDNGQYDNPRPVFWATGACMLVRMDAYRQMNGLEPRFFAHMEEIDLCWRWQHAGYQVWVEPQSVVYHLGGGTLAKTNPRKTLLNFRNGLALLYMNSLGVEVWWKILIRLVLDGVAGVQFLFKCEWQNTLAILRAHIAFYSAFGYWTAKRKMNQSAAVKSITSGYFGGSIVWSYFVRRKKRFSDL